MKSNSAEVTCAVPFFLALLLCMHRVRLELVGGILSHYKMSMYDLTSVFSRTIFITWCYSGCWRWCPPTCRNILCQSNKLC